MNAFNKKMAKENEMDDYEKVEIYNTEVINKLSAHYKEILKMIGKGYRDIFNVRTPYVAFYWQSTRCVYSQWIYCGVEQNSTGC